MLTLTFFPFTFTMPPSASPAPAPAPAPTLDATELISLKRKLAIIEAEHNMMKGQGPQT